MLLSPPHGVVVVRAPLALLAGVGPCDRRCHQQVYDGIQHEVQGHPEVPLPSSEVDHDCSRADRNDDEHRIDGLPCRLEVDAVVVVVAQPFAPKLSREP